MTADTAPTVSSRIHAELRREILAGRYAPGEALPSERRLSDDLGAGRHAVREALKRLQQAGLIRIAHGGATRVQDWRHHGGLDLLLALGAEGDAPPELELERATLEMRACVGADAARRCAQRAGAARRAELVARAEALAETPSPAERTLIYDAFWDAVIDGADNVAYRLALTTLVAGQRILDLGPERVAGEVGDAAAVRRLAHAIADGDAPRAHRLAAELLERSVPGGEA